MFRSTPVSYTHLDVYKRQGLGREVEVVVTLSRLQVIQPLTDCLVGKACLLYTSIFNHAEMAKQSEEDMWVDSYEVCTFLKISEKTLRCV